MNTVENLLEELTASLTQTASDQAIEPRKALAWARVSTDMQQERGLSIPQQLREIHEYARQRGIEIVGEFSEAASAFQREDSRVEFHRMLDRAKSDPQVNAILVHDLSRFSRDSLQARSLIQELDKAGVKVISLNDPQADPESPAGVYLEAITYAKNEAYSREIAFHTRKGCRANVQTRDPETRWCYKNGGQPLWGYRAQRLVRGQEKNGRPIIKSIWALDKTLVAGRPVHEWARYCLVDLAARGATLDELRDFCNSHGIPGRRSAHWSTSTWNSLLEPSVLLQYCGYGVWNVHKKKGSTRPPSEWVVVENAHPAIITADEAKAIASARRFQSRAKRFDLGYGKSRTSPYLCSGGLFKCARCGSNMIGFRTSSGRYYVCGSQPYRRGMGCGPGVYVPQAQLESEVVTGLAELLGVCADPARFTRQVNSELRDIWKRERKRDPQQTSGPSELDDRIANVRRAIENGLQDADWANARLRELTAERQALQAAALSNRPPQIDTRTALAYRRDAEKLLASGTPAERKQPIRTCVQDMKLAPERFEVEITYRIPEPVMNGVVAGARFYTDRCGHRESASLGDLHKAS